MFENQLFQIWKSAHKTLNISDVFGIVFALDSQAFPLVANNLEPVFVDKRNRFEELVLVQILKYFNPSFGGNKVQSSRRIFIGTEKSKYFVTKIENYIFNSRKRNISYLKLFVNIFDRVSIQKTSLNMLAESCQIALNYSMAGKHYSLEFIAFLGAFVRSLVFRGMLN